MAERGRRRTARKRNASGRRRGIVWLALATVVLIGLLFAFVYPTRTFLDQRADTSRAREQLEVLQTENAELAVEAARLNDPAEIEKLARRYGLVKPNEQPFVIVPAPTVAPVPEPAPPAGGASSTRGASTPSP